MFHSVDGGWSEGNKFYFVLLENKEDIQRHTVTWFGNDKRLETKEDGLKIGYASHDGNKKVLWKNYAVIINTWLDQKQYYIMNNYSDLRWFN